MAHGVLYLLGGWVGYHVYLSTGEWGLGLLAATGIRRRGRTRHAAGVPTLEPGSGPAPGDDHDHDLGDHGRPDSPWFGGTAHSIAWPDVLDKSSPLYFFDLHYPFVRFFILLARSRSGLALALAEQDENRA